MSRTRARTVTLYALTGLLAAGLVGCGTRDQADGKPASAAADKTASTPATANPTPTEPDPVRDAMEDTMASNERNREEMDRQASEAALAETWGNQETALLLDATGYDTENGADLIEATGYRWIIDDDALGQGRAQTGDWVVCSQTPASGTYRIDTLVTLHAVKRGETCP